MQFDAHIYFRGAGSNTNYQPTTPPKTNMDTKNDGLENVSHFEYGHFGYLCWISGGYCLKLRTSLLHVHLLLVEIGCVTNKYSWIIPQQYSLKP